MVAGTSFFRRSKERGFILQKKKKKKKNCLYSYHISWKCNSRLRSYILEMPKKNFFVVKFIREGEYFLPTLNHCKVKRASERQVMVKEGDTIKYYDA